MTTAGTLVGSPFFAALLRKETPAIKDDEGFGFCDFSSFFFWSEENMEQRKHFYRSRRSIFWSSAIVHVSGHVSCLCWF